MLYVQYRGNSIADAQTVHPLNDRRTDSKDRTVLFAGSVTTVINTISSLLAALTARMLVVPP